MTMTIKGLLGKDVLTYHEASTLLKQVAELLNRVPQAALRNVGQAKQDVDAVLDVARELGGKLVEIQKEIDAAEEKVYRMYEATYGRIIKKRHEIEKRFQGPMPEIRLPYNVKEFLDVAERMGQLSPEAWARFVEFAQALRE